MIDLGFHAIHADTAEETFADFKSFLEYVEGGGEGFHTLYFCRYGDFKIYTEVIHILVQRGHLIFLESPKQLTLILDKDLAPTRLEFNPEAETFLNIMVATKNSTFLGAYCDPYGNMFNAFCLNDGKSIAFGRYWRVHLIEQMDVITELERQEEIQSEERMAQVADDYLGVRVAKFKEKVQEAINSGEIYEGFDENPLSHYYYNSPEVNGTDV